CNKRDEIVNAAAGGFVVILPVMGLYGIFQFVDPPDWDRYWMSFAVVTTGEPIPYGVRTFSTMNGPASFATFTAAGLLIVFLLRQNILTFVAMSPAAISLLLSTYRTAWLSLMIGLVFCVLHPAARGRATVILIALSAIVLTALAVLGSFTDVISDRLASFSQ